MWGSPLRGCVLRGLCTLPSARPAEENSTGSGPTGQTVTHTSRRYFLSISRLHEANSHVSDISKVICHSSVLRATQNIQAYKVLQMFQSTHHNMDSTLLQDPNRPVLYVQLLCKWNIISKWIHSDDILILCEQCYDGVAWKLSAKCSPIWGTPAFNTHTHTLSPGKTLHTVKCDLFYCISVYWTVSICMHLYQKSVCRNTRAFLTSRMNQLSSCPLYQCLQFNT